jgi:hypothetical protein
MFVFVSATVIAASYSDWKLWDARDRKLVESFDGHRSDVTGIAINSKGTGAMFSSWWRDDSLSRVCICASCVTFD